MLEGQGFLASSVRAAPISADRGAAVCHLSLGPVSTRWLDAVCFDW